MLIPPLEKDHGNDGAYPPILIVSRYGFPV